MDERDKQPQQPSADMPLLAASAAARMVHDILARLGGPHAGLPLAPGPLRPGSLWRQVVRRVGGKVSPETGSVARHHQLPPPTNVPYADFVWRARRHPTAPDEADGIDPGWLPLTPRPVIPITPTPPATIKFPDANDAALGEPVQMPAPLLPQQDVGGPPVFVPPRVVQVAYEPGPALLPPVPLAAQRLDAELNRDLVPTTDLLSRMAYTHEVELVAPAPQATPEVFQEPSIPETPAPVVVAPPIEARPLRMPLAPQPEARKAPEARPSPDYLVPVSERGPVGRLIDRVVSALPVLEPLRRSTPQETTPKKVVSQEIVPQQVGSVVQAPVGVESPQQQVVRAPAPASQPAQPASTSAKQPQPQPQPQQRTPASPDSPPERTPFITPVGPSEGGVRGFVGRLFAGETRSESAGSAPLSMPQAAPRSSRKADETSPGPPAMDVGQPTRQQPAQPIVQAQPPLLQDLTSRHPVVEGSAPEIAPEKAAEDLNDNIVTSGQPEQPLEAPAQPTQEETIAQLPTESAISEPPTQTFFGRLMGRVLGGDATTDTKPSVSAPSPLDMPLAAHSVGQPERDASEIVVGEQPSSQVETSQPASSSQPSVVSDDSGTIGAIVVSPESAAQPPQPSTPTTASQPPSLTTASTTMPAVQREQANWDFPGEEATDHNTVSAKLNSAPEPIAMPLALPARREGEAEAEGDNEQTYDAAQLEQAVADPPSLAQSQPQFQPQQTTQPHLTPESAALPQVSQNGDGPSPDAPHQTWAVMTDMSAKIAKSHAPIVPIEPPTVVDRSGLTGRIYSRQIRNTQQTGRDDVSLLANRPIDNRQQLTGTQPTVSRVQAVTPTATTTSRESDNTAWTASSVEDGENDAPDYMSVLRELYGRETRSAGMPLAYPYSVFAAPGEGQPSMTIESYSLMHEGEEAEGSSEGYLEAGSYPEPSSEYEATSSDGGVGAITGMSWGVAGLDSGIDTGGGGSEASAWAGVVSSAVAGSYSGAPALALSGEERPIASAQGQDAQQGKLDKRAEEPHLEALADSVYTIIRRRLEIERERNW